MTAAELSMADRLTLERTFTQADFDRFADLSGDDNPIHVDPAFSAKTRFGRTVAHGVLLATVLRGMVALLVPGGRQGTQALMFTAPTYADEPMRFEARVTARTADAVTLAFEVRRVADGEITCRGETRVALAGATDAVTSP